MNITNEVLTKIAVSSTEQLLNSHIPLSESLAKQASEYGLNSDQIQRAIEATNTLTQLKAMALSSDKTVEFPLAKYAEVVQHLSPDLTVTPQEPSELTDPLDFFDKQAGQSGVSDLEKAASSEDSSAAFWKSMSENERKFIMMKQAETAKVQVEDLTCKSMQVALGLRKTAQELKTQDQWQMKLACVASREEFATICALAGDRSRPFPDLGAAKEYLYKKAELAVADKVTSLLREGQEITEKLKPYRHTLEKAAGFADNMKRSVEGIRGANRPTGVVGAVTKGVDTGLNIAGTALHHTLDPIGKAVGATAGLAVGGTLGAVGSVGKGLAGMLKSKKVMVDGQVVSKSRIPGVAGGALTGALNAAMYEPKRNVWDTLQRSV